MKYKFKKKPYHHQVQAIKKLISTGFGGALLMEPRTGKTKVIIDYLSILHQHGKANRVLIFTPVAGLGVWKDEIASNCPWKYRLLIWDRKARRGRRRRGVRQPEKLPPFGDDVLDFVVMNYDALSTPGRVTGRDNEGNVRRSRRRGGRYDILRQIELWQPQVIVLDESHRIKSWMAKKTRGIMKLQPIPDYRVIMTGTLVTKKKRIFDIYPQWQFLNPDRFPNMTHGQFKEQYGKWTRRNGFPQWLKNINEEDLHDKIHQDAFSITREECYDLPAQTHQIIRVELEESADVYDQMAEDMVAKIRTGEITEASIKLVQGMRLRQITSGLSKTMPSEEYPQGRLVVIGSEKLRAIQARLEDLLEMDEKVVIGAVWKGDLTRLQKLCQNTLKVPTFVVKGGVSNADREYARTQFPKVDGGAVFIGQPAAAGEAIDLSCASIMQWYSLTPSWVHFRQFSDRIALSAKPTFFEYFLAGPADELVYETLQEDGDLGKKIITSPERLLRLQESK